MFSAIFTYDLGNSQAGHTPLGIAAASGELRILHALLNARADINHKCSKEHKDLPLFRACRFNKEQVRQEHSRIRPYRRGLRVCELAISAGFRQTSDIHLRLAWKRDHAT